MLQDVIFFHLNSDAARQGFDLLTLGSEKSGKICRATRSALPVLGETPKKPVF
jgi:hypothetical protein